jgi:hypothetical protein
MSASVVRINPTPHSPELEAAYMANHYTFVTWKWKPEDNFRSRYTADHVNVMQQMLAKNVKAPHRVICVTDDPDNVRVETFPLWDDGKGLKNVSGHHLPSCYRRLKLFDKATQESLGITSGRIVSIDLDSVILDDMMPLLWKPEMFVGWGVPGTRHNVVFNGSMWMFNAGDELQWMWDTFKPDFSPQRALAAGFFGSDQGYISHQLAYSQLVGKWTAQDGVLSYVRDVRGPRILPKHARVVMFHGKRKPWDPNVRRESKWIEKYWKVTHDLQPA